MPARRSLTGVGPKLALAALPAVLIAVATTIAFPVGSRLFLPRGLELIVGATLLALGLALYGTSAVQLLLRFKKGELITTGAYAWSQNPLYSSFIFFLAPAMALFADSWPLMLVPPVLYAAVKFFIDAEYEEMEAAFGPRYRDYRAQTSELFPLPPHSVGHAHAA